MPPTDWTTQRAVGCGRGCPFWRGQVAWESVRPVRRRSSRAASTSTHTVMTIRSARRRSGFFSARAAAKQRGALRDRTPRATWCWPGSPASRSRGGQVRSSRALVARMNQRCWAPSAAWAALDAASAPARGSTPAPVQRPTRAGPAAARGSATRRRRAGPRRHRPGGAAERLNGVGCGRARLVPVWVDRAPGLGTAGLGVDQHPAGCHFPSG